MKKTWGIWAFALLLMTGCSSDEYGSSGNAFAKGGELSYYEKVVALEAQWQEFFDDKKAIENSNLDEEEKYEQIIQISELYKERVDSYELDNPSTEGEEALSIAATEFQSNFHALLDDGYIAFYSSGYVTPDMKETLSEVTELAGMFNMMLDVSIDEFEDNHN